MAVWREAAELLVRLGHADEALDAYRLLADSAGAAEPPWLAALARVVSGRPEPVS
jgi:hypothetical protein